MMMNGSGGGGGGGSVRDIGATSGIMVMNYPRVEN